MRCSIRPLERIPNARYAKRVYKVSIAFLGKYRTTVNANCIELPIIEACRLHYPLKSEVADGLTVGIPIKARMDGM